MTHNKTDPIDITKDISIHDISTDVAEHFSEAVDAIDAVFGRGYAKDHPELIGAFVQACAADRQTEVLIRGLEAIAQEIRDPRTQTGIAPKAPPVPTVPASEGGTV